MKAIYNSRILSEQGINLHISNRAFCYGDGLFETIVTGPGRINLIPLHIARLSQACAVLDIALPFDEEILNRHINTLKTTNTLVGQTRIKVQLWRNSGGLYAPNERTASYIITAAASNRPFYSSINQVAVSQKARVGWHALSFAKTMSAMPYVLAGLEKKQSPYEDLIITDHQKNIAECIASNIFWTYEEQVFTPALSTGCVNGTMRQHLISKFVQAKIKVHEVSESISSLHKAKHVFICNASGIQWVKNFEDRTSYTDPEALLQKASILPPLL